MEAKGKESRRGDVVPPPIVIVRQKILEERRGDRADRVPRGEGTRMHRAARNFLPRREMRLRLVENRDSISIYPRWITMDRSVFVDICDFYGDYRAKRFSAVIHRGGAVTFMNYAHLINAGYRRYIVNIL